jgi:hypothetical protein
MQGSFVPAVPSYIYLDKKWFYVLQEKLGAGLDGEVWKAKMKIEDIDLVTGKKLATRRIYVCIKKLNHNYKKD